MAMIKAAVFASGTGSNFDAIVKASEAGGIPCDIQLLVCDRKDAVVITKAEQKNIDTFVFSPKEFDGKDAYERQILLECRERGIEWVFLAGYMRLIGPVLLEPFKNRIINIHPSLLPAFPGKDAIGQAFEKQVKVTGVTIHYIDDGMDTGPIIEQEAIRITAKDTKETLQQKIQAVEHSLYPKVIQSLLVEEEVH
ncbi:phosphoribosylglycinamide formyltransferase [Thalassobacillus devorans]|uniref:Phosphoribosylglycinamide formyltransferase n=1 Tax=Thalassobacillus devorans TaxID=279813 RepID=A0ABQ1PJG0_9BACI|nr:phosphoribosylglycinamide formyltransferase-1 [Thalassobacillus devorans]GGC98345.1 phosphoribosylglycinamide formyltransferase [Thalassobacillus devorans]